MLGVQVDFVAIRQGIGVILSWLFVGGCLFLLWGIIRFSIVSKWRTRGATDFLRKPDIAGVSAACGFAVPSELGDFYREVAFIDQGEFDLVDPGQSPPKRWFIGEFLPLIPAVAKEWRAIGRVKGLPIATDMNKGIYCLSGSGAVTLESPNVAGGSVVVASSIEDLRRFRVATPDEANEDDA